VTPARGAAAGATALRDLGVEHLKGVGPSLKGKLERLGIFRLGDLLAHMPIRYQDRSRLVPLDRLEADKDCLVEGQVVESRVGFGRRRSWAVTITDGRGFLTLRFFHFSRRQQQAVQTGMGIRAFGEVRFGPRGLEMAHPDYRTFGSTPPPLEAGLTPVYRVTKGLTQNRLRALIDQLAGLDCRGAVLDAADLQGADLAGADLGGAGLAGANLQLVDATGTRFVDADLRDVQAAGAFFGKADFSGADLSGIYVGEGNMGRARMRGTRLHGAHLRWTRGVNSRLVAEALGDHRTLLPEAMRPPEHWA